MEVSANRVGSLRFRSKKPTFFREHHGGYPFRHHDFRRLLDPLGHLNPAQIEHAQKQITDIRRRTEVISEIEARTSQEQPCQGCGKTYSDRTGSVIGRTQRPHLFMVALRDMLGPYVPQSVRKLARQLGLNKYTVWRWRMLVFSIIGHGAATAFSGIIEADETYQREARKGSREWVRHFADPQNVPQPPRPRWKDFTTKGLKMMRCLSKWQLPILTVADRGGARLFQRLPNRQSATLERAMNPHLPQDAVLCSDGANRYATVAANGGIEHFLVGGKPGTRVVAGYYRIQNVNSLHARYDKSIKPFCGPSTKNLNGYIGWLEVRLAGMGPADVIRAS